LRIRLLKTADAGYLTRRLVDVAQDVIINEVDCGTLRGIVASALEESDEVVETLEDRILGRTSVHDVFILKQDELIVEAGEEINRRTLLKPLRLQVSKKLKFVLY
jgi:DNA-directed RNA polymerase subunit beta'